MIRRRNYPAHLEPLEERRLFGAGDLDPTFNGHGFANIDVGSARIIDIAAQSDSKIIVAGTIGNDAAANFFLARFNADGSPDTTFGNHGTVQTDFGGADAISDIAIDAQNGILATGTGGPNADFAVARYTASGTLDTTFSADGKTLVPFGGEDSPVKIFVLSGGKIEVVGSTTGGGIDATRLNSDGSFDTSFAGDGTANLPYLPADESGFRMFGITTASLESDGSVLIGGAAGSYEVARAADVMLTPSGTLRDFTDYGSDDDEISQYASDPQSGDIVSTVYDSFYGFHLDVPAMSVPGTVDATHDTQAILPLGNDQFVYVGSPQDDNARPAPGVVLLRVSLDANAGMTNLVTNFGTQGVARTQFTADSPYYIYDAATDSQNRVIVLASTGTQSILLRYQTTGISNSPVTLTHTGTLSITGTSAADDIAVTDSEVDISGVAYPFDGTKVKRITINAGDGNDTVHINTKRPATILGGNGDDSLIGGTLGDSISGGAGNDTIDGEAGNNTLTGGDGNDTAEYDDRPGGDFFEVSFDDEMKGVDPELPAMQATGADQIDSLTDFFETIGGTEFVDRFVQYGAAPSQISLLGRGGNDDFELFFGQTVEDGGPGDDIFDLPGANITLEGGSGKDLFILNQLPASLDGGSGVDKIKEGDRFGSPTLNLNDFQSVENATGFGTIIGNDEPNLLAVAYPTLRADLVGGGGNDILIGGDAGGYFDGGDGDDLLQGGNGKDTMFGGNGNDIIAGAGGNDKIHGGDGDDILVGGRGHDRLYGDAGDDQIIARDNLRDTLYGGDGTDEASVDQSKKIKDLFAEIESILT